ncbi:MAG: substrate-binding domain-containing protein [Pseudomonadota bacterium]
MRMAVTTSFNNSGLSDILLPQIKEDTGIDVRLLVVGTGQALKLGRSGDVDAVLVHSRAAEEAFVEEGYGTHRRKIMYNDFIIAGPSEDPAKIALGDTASAALQKIRDAGSPFVSRGDDSGTHKMEIALWGTSGLDASSFNSLWYRATGSGMGAALNTASGMNAYILSDRASWLKFRNKGDLKLLFEGDPALFNQYSYLPVDPSKHPHVRNDLARKLEAWLIGDKAQKLIGEYKISDEGLFTPNARLE